MTKGKYLKAKQAFYFALWYIIICSFSTDSAGFIRFNTSSLLLLPMSLNIKINNRREITEAETGARCFYVSIIQFLCFHYKEDSRKVLANLKDLFLGGFLL